MPVFHTKTIESILEPVAQQISKLVILHEDADNGNVMPDLSIPVQIVQKAADNLVKVGHDTCDNSEDSILKKKFPEALIRVEQACNALNEAAIILKSDPKSPSGKLTLLKGERGILEGVSDILLAFDESEVRKIVHLCNKVVEYLYITELIEKLDDLVAYVKNLTPILTKMTREVDAREKELTHQIHRDKLSQHLEQVKALTPSFISSIKIYLIISSGIQNDNTDRNQIINSIQETKEFLIRRLSYEINEIVRILQLTSDTEGESTSDDLIFFTQNMANFEIDLKSALDWLSDDNLINNNLGEKFIRELLEQSTLIANKIQKPHGEKILDTCSAARAIFHNILMLSQDGKRNSNITRKNCEILKNQLLSLDEILKQSINTCIYSYKLKPEATLIGKLEQASKWCDNPNLDDCGIGQMAAKLIVEEAKKVFHKEASTDTREDFEKLIFQCEYLIDELLSLNTDIKIDRTSLHNAGKQVYDCLNLLVRKINRYLIQKFADDFLDINGHVKKIANIVFNSKKIDNSLEKFSQISNDFLAHSQKVCDTANEIAQSTSQVKNKRTIELINQFTKRIVELGPQVVNTAYLVLKFPDNKSCLENFELMQQQWEINMLSLQKLLDEIVDCESFIIACEKSIIRETYETQAAVQDKNSSIIVTNALNVARRTNRIIQVVAQEAENSEDKLYVEKILTANEFLKQSLPSLIQSAKLLALEPNNKENYLVWASSNELLIDAISKVRESVSNINNRSSISNDEDLSSNELSILEELKINDDNINNTYVMPKYRPIPVSRPTPLPDLVEENESEFPEPQNNQPILMAAHDLHYSVNQYYSTDNDIIAVAKRITFLMARLSELVRGENGTKKDLIATAKQLADESLEICRIARVLANDCTDKRMRMNLLQVCERIPTIGTQLKILSTVKATLLGAQGNFINFNDEIKTNNKLRGSERIYATKEDEEATEMLIVNAQNLNSSVKATVRAAKSASIKLRPDSSLKFKWIRKKYAGYNRFKVF